MAVVETLTVKHHQQDTDYYCGAACAQMVLATIGAGILDQDDLYADNHSHSTAEAGWASGPDGLTWTMNDRRPPAFTNSFVLFALNGEDAISRKICWTIHHYQVAPIALVFGWAHWIVVHGYDATAHPTSSADLGYAITGFTVNNPWPPTPAGAPEPPHTGTDGCGTGGTRGVADEHIAYSPDWQDTYMTGVPAGFWSGKFIAVCDPEPPATRPGEQSRPDRLPGRDLVAPREAVARLQGAFEKSGLRQRRDFAQALEGTRPDEPLLVRRLDLPDSYYYIVPMRRDPRRVPVLGRIDARFGTYRSTLILPREGTMHEFVAGRRALDQLAGGRVELPRQRGRILVRKEAMCIYPTLVWRPCRESLSPFWPFHMASIGGERIYVRIDGQVFSELHVEPGI